MKKQSAQNKIPKRLSPSITEGLNDVQVNARMECGMRNLVSKKYSKSYLSIFVDNICTVFNLLGLTVFVALLCISDMVKITDFFFVLFYIANITIGIIQEIRAKHSVDKLSIMSNKTTKVVRNGELREISAEDIVLDDIIKLGIGNQIPTDCIILDGDIEVNESLISGESIAVKRRVGEMLLAGSFITSGTCYARAERVGKENYVETLSAKAKQYKRPHSEIMSSLKTIIKVIICLIIPIAIAWILKTSITEDFATAIYKTSTPVIGMIPSGMFLLTSVALAVGIIKLAKHNTLVQDLYSLEMLARVDTICFDKTGTITNGDMTVSEVVPLCESNYDAEKIMGSMLNALKADNQTALALKQFFNENDTYSPTFTLPFNSARKLSAVTFENIGTFAFGAPEFVLTNNEYAKIAQKVNEYAKRGLRVLVFAHTDTPLAENFLPRDFTPLSLFIIADNVREDAIKTIAWFKENDVAVKVISGDNPLTVSEVSKRVGIPNAEHYISLEGLSEKEVEDAANKYTVFGRVSPEQKAILIRSLKAAGHVTAMTGDGVNDILALKEADCAISVAAGSDAARNVSHIVLMDNNFNSMPKIVHEGRRVINNVQSSASLFLMKTIFTMLMAVITLFLPYMTAYPYKLSNMIMFEVFIAGIPSTLLSFQPNDSRVEGSFINKVIAKSLPAGVLMVLSVLMVEAARIFVNMYSPEQMVYETMGIYVLTYVGLINLFMTCRPFNKFRTILFTLTTLIILTLTYLSFNGQISNLLSLTVMLPLSEYWHHLVITAVIIIINIPLAFVLRNAFNKIDVNKFFSKIFKNQ